jgi:hypothetical protein
MIIRYKRGLLDMIKSAKLRDKNENTFEDNLTLAQPRTDKIDLGPAARSQPPTAGELAPPINDHLKMLVQQAALSEQSLPAALERQN